MNKKQKAIHLIETYPDMVSKIPWQKTFETTARNKYLETCFWILSLRTIYNFEIDIHFNDDELFNKIVNL